MAAARKKTVGVSPKVWAVVGALASPGLVLVVLGAVMDSDTLITIGAALLGAAPIAGGAGYSAPPGPVVADRKKVERVD